jgi:hypothetical protein
MTEEEYLKMQAFEVVQECKFFFKVLEVPVMELNDK